MANGLYHTVDKSSGIAPTGGESWVARGLPVMRPTISIILETIRRKQGLFKICQVCEQASVSGFSILDPLFDLHVSSPISSPASSHYWFVSCVVSSRLPGAGLSALSDPSLFVDRYIYRCFPAYRFPALYTLSTPYYVLRMSIFVVINKYGKVPRRCANARNG